MRFEARFGTLWVDRYINVPQKVMLETWAEDLGDLTPEQLRAGYVAAKSLKYPPNAGEFYNICKEAAPDYVPSHQQITPLPAPDRLVNQEELRRITAQMMAKLTEKTHD